jgi:hypothetical protein
MRRGLMKGTRKGFKDGDKRWHNLAIEEAIRSIKSKLYHSNSAGHGRVFVGEVITELEKLKK